VLRRREQRRFPSASDDEVGGSNARDARAAQEIVARAGIEPATFHFSGERYYRLSYLALCTVMGLHHQLRDPDGTRTRDLRRDRAAR
jgi:hypothetical protein